MRAQFVVVTLCMCVLRVAWAVLGVRAGVWGLVPFALHELLAGVFGVLALVRARHVDDSRRGLLVPLLYLVPVALSVEGSQPPAWLGVASAAMSVVQVWVLCTLAHRFTCGASAFVDVCSKGPYGVVRHPILALCLAHRALIVGAFPSPWNVGTLLLFAAAMVVVVVVEEGWLAQFREYRLYRDQVRWRLVPGVW